MTNSIHYMLTITKHQKKDHVTPEELDEVVVKLQNSIDNFIVYEDAYENSGKYKQLHMHLIVSTDEAFRFSPRWTSLDGFQLKWKRVYDMRKAINYIYKDQNGSRDGQVNPKYAQNQESILWSNRWNHVLCF